MSVHHGPEVAKPHALRLSLGRDGANRADPRDEGRVSESNDGPAFLAAAARRERPRRVGEFLVKRIYLSVPHMGTQEEVFVRDAFATNQLSTVGPHLDEFEREMSSLVGLPAVAAAGPPPSTWACDCWALGLATRWLRRRSRSSQARIQSAT